MGGDSSHAPPPLRILLINPNTTSSITGLLNDVYATLSLESSLTPSYFTCPSPGIPSINSPDDANESADLCLPHLIPELPHHDLFLICCYSHHPLVHQLKEECTKLPAEATHGGSGARKYVTGIFEASVLQSLQLLHPKQSFGVVSTGKIWETAVTEAVHGFLGAKDVQRYVGCETTGLNADQLHDLPKEQVFEKMKDATKKLFEKGSEVGAICLGCAGMVGLDEAVREACLEELGEEKGKQVHIVDGVKAGIVQLFGAGRGAF